MTEHKPTQDTKILQLSPVAIHTLYSHSKKLKHLGVLSIIQKPNHSLWFLLNHHSSYQLLKGTHFLKIVYPHHISYLFDAIRGGFVAISVKVGSPEIPQFQNILRKQGQLMEYTGDIHSTQLRKKIEYHCPDVLEKPVHSENFMTPMFSLAGSLENRVFSAFDSTGSKGTEQPKNEEKKDKDQVVEPSTGIKGMWRRTVEGIVAVGSGIKSKIMPSREQQAPNMKEEIKAQYLQPNEKKKDKSGKVEKQQKVEKVDKVEKVEKVEVKIDENITKEVEKVVATEHIPQPDPKIESPQTNPQVIDPVIDPVSQPNTQEQEKTPEIEPQPEEVNPSELNAKPQESDEDEAREEQGGKKKKRNKNKNKAR